MSNSSEREQPAGNREPTAEQTQGVLWPPETVFPATVDVAILFHGLFCFAYNRTTGFCEVGVHSRAPNHNFILNVLEVEPSGIIRPVVLPTVHGPSINLDVIQPRNPGVRFFQPSSPDDHDWRHVPDLEGPNFYNLELEKIRGSRNPIITIRHGVFYTAVKTQFEFIREAEDDPLDIRELGGIAFYAGAALSHDGGRVLLNIAGQDIPLEATGGKKHIVSLSNMCPRERPRCRFNPHSTIKEERNDFHLYFETARVPDHRPEFLLRIKPGVERKDASVPSATSKSAPSSVDFIDFDLLETFAPTSTHDAPCGVIGFGQTGGGFGGS
jgi:hypothetical protein